MRAEATLLVKNGAPNCAKRLPPVPIRDSKNGTCTGKSNCLPSTLCQRVLERLPPTSRIIMCIQQLLNNWRATQYLPPLPHTHSHWCYSGQWCTGPCWSNGQKGRKHGGRHRRSGIINGPQYWRGSTTSPTKTGKAHSSWRIHQYVKVATGPRDTRPPLEGDKEGE